MLLPNEISKEGIEYPNSRNCSLSFYCPLKKKLEGNKLELFSESSILAQFHVSVPLIAWLANLENMSFGIRHKKWPWKNIFQKGKYHPLGKDLFQAFKKGQNFSLGNKLKLVNLKFFIISWLEVLLVPWMPTCIRLPK